jgi:hypothetical protein
VPGNRGNPCALFGQVDKVFIVAGLLSQTVSIERHDAIGEAVALSVQ